MPESGVVFAPEDLLSKGHCVIYLWEKALDENFPLRQKKRKEKSKYEKKFSKKIINSK